jgi:hypothetical protein
MKFFFSIFFEILFIHLYIFLIHSHSCPSIFVHILIHFRSRFHRPQDSLLAKYRPDLLHLPTTNGDHTTGDGIKMGEAIGARSIDLEWVQVHPTGLVEPDDPEVFSTVDGKTWQKRG